MFRSPGSLVLAAAFLAAASVVTAQDEEPSTLLKHPAEQTYYVGGQVNLIFQSHADFPALYSGPQSFRATSEHALSRLLTLYTGLRVAKRWSVLFDVESAGGKGLSDAPGLAGFTNLDVVRNPSLGSTPYVARLMVHGVIPLSVDEIAVEPTPLSLPSRVPARRLEVRAG